MAVGLDGPANVSPALHKYTCTPQRFKPEGGSGSGKSSGGDPSSSSSSCGGGNKAAATTTAAQKKLAAASKGVKSISSFFGKKK